MPTASGQGVAEGFGAPIYRPRTTTLTATGVGDSFRHASLQRVAAAGRRRAVLLRTSETVADQRSPYVHIASGSRRISSS